MKRLFFLVTFIVLAIPSHAQLNVQSQSEAFERIGTLRSTYAYVYAQGTTYFLGIRTSNQFDEGCFFALGNTAESSILTAQDLIQAANAMEKNSYLTVMDAESTGANITKKIMLGKPYLVIHMDGKAGESNITVAELEHAIEIIKEHAHEEE